MNYIPYDKNKRSKEDQPQLQLEIYPLEWYYSMPADDSGLYVPSSYEVDFTVKEVNLDHDSSCKRVIIIDM